MERQIIRIDEEKCDGCGLCAGGCPEGALQIIDGKARLVSEITCDGLGACIGSCPRGAIQVETREAAPYDERATLEQILPKGPNTLRAHLKHLFDHGQTTFLQEALTVLQEKGVPVPDFREQGHGHGHGHAGCPGSAQRTLRRPPSAPAAPREGLESRLSHWPVQLHLVSPMNPDFHGADLLLAADCTAFALPDFNQAWLPGRKLAIACPKLDQGQDIYVDKLKVLIDQAEINTLTVMIMEVPCCGGLLRLAQRAAQEAGRAVPIQVVVVGLDGEIRKKEWVKTA